MAQSRTWLDEILDAFKELGEHGKFDVSELADGQIKRLVVSIKNRFQ